MHELAWQCTCAVPNPGRPGGSGLPSWLAADDGGGVSFRHDEIASYGPTFGRRTDRSARVRTVRRAIVVCVDGRQYDIGCLSTARSGVVDGVGVRWWRTSSRGL